VTGNFFEVMDISLVQGHPFELNDAAGEPSVVISRALAERLWNGQGAAGRFIEGAQMDRSAQVVGVAEDARYVDLWDSRPTVYRRAKLDNRLASEVLLRTSVPPLPLIAEVRRAWRSMSPDLRISAIRSGDDYVRLATESQRLASHLFTVFSLIALLVASIGLYSSMAWFVERRRREIAIRMAVGGAPGTIASRVILRAGVIGSIGLILGLGTAALLAPQLASVSRNASPYDALAFGGTAVVLAAVCLLAVVAPAVRASRVDPVMVLRSE
jgi:putative ABC transport system permease protein